MKETQGVPYKNNICLHKLHYVCILLEFKMVQTKDGLIGNVFL